ncbi:hypothetical protein NEAUS07_0238 [Nematocida ausubeli]|nr:hypothetical protein NEAUS07_0238 [Nematocida ausubeli]KAI5134516.1 hypothetical protein NEAUS06_1132 [Nematocida ausubeli]
MEEVKSEKCFSRMLLLLIKGVNSLIIPFDIKALLVIGLEYVSAGLHRILQKKEEKETHSSSAEEPIRKTAVMLDGTSKHGVILRKKLAEEGYSVIYPDENGISEENMINIPIKIRNEASINLFVKKISLYGRIDLLVLNSAKRSISTQVKIRPIKGLEKKIIPSKDKKGFISKNELYKEKNRVLLEKDSNAKKNYLFNFLLIRGLAEKLKAGDGVVVLCIDRIFMIADKAPSMLPSYFFSYCHSQLLALFLGIGTKSRYTYLDVRIVGSCFLTDQWTSAAIGSIRQKRSESVQYFNGSTEEKIDESYTDRANDLWENAEMVS